MRVYSIRAICSANVLQVRNSYYYLDADHLGNQELYDRLNIADPDAPPVPTGVPGAELAAAPASAAAAAQPGPVAAEGAGKQGLEPGADAPRADEEVPEQAVAPTAPPESAADEAAAAQAEQAAEMVQQRDRPQKQSWTAC